MSEDTVEIKEGDVVKIDMGVHVDGYIAVVAHTVVCGGGDVPCTGRKADVQQAAWQARRFLPLLPPPRGPLA